MGIYKNIILAVELDPAIDMAVTAAAVNMVKQTGANLSLIHVIELPSYNGMYGVAIATGVQDELFLSAENAMAKLGEQLGVPKGRQIVKFGIAKVLILEEAEKIAADLIVIGRHGRHGIQILLGSTANAILHQAKCDVFAVMLKNDKPLL